MCMYNYDICNYSICNVWWTSRFLYGCWKCSFMVVLNGLLYYRHQFHLKFLSDINWSLMYKMTKWLWVFWYTVLLSIYLFKPCLRSFNMPRTKPPLPAPYIYNYVQHFCVGECDDTMMCSCDQGYSGDTCTPTSPHPNYLKEGFPLADGPNELPEQLVLLGSFVKG